VEQGGLTVRAAEPDDVGTIAGLYLEVAAEVVAREPSFRHVPDGGEVERRYQSRIGEADQAVLVAVSGNVVVGFVDASLQRHEGGGTYHRTGIDVYVEELIVTASKRRRGVGTALMRAIEAWGRNAEARMIWLDTHVTNASARGLYGAIGYREVGVESAIPPLRGWQSPSLGSRREPPVPFVSILAPYREILKTSSRRGSSNTSQMSSAALLRTSSCWMSLPAGSDTGGSRCATSSRSSTTVGRLRSSIDYFGSVRKAPQEQVDASVA
jgi:ribosomal protein S18 acetylase RimI-like enzyme